MPIIKLHRGSESTMSTSPKKNIVLDSGELFIEIPDNEVTEDNQYKFKVGDGSTTYENLPYAIDPTNISSNGSNSGNSSGNEEEIDYISKNNVTLSGSSNTTVTFTDDSIKSKSITELVSNISEIQYSSINKSNGSCSFVFPPQGSNKTVSFRLYINANYYNSTSKSLAGTATVAQVKSGKTFTSASGIGLTGTAVFKLFYRDINETVTCNLSGSHTKTNYECDVVYCGPKT